MTRSEGVARYAISPNAILVGLCLFVAASLGCKKDKADDTGGTSSSNAPVVVGPAPEKTALTELPALRHVPASAPLAFAVDGVLPMMDRLGRTAIMKKHAALVAKGAEASRAALGHDLTDPSGWAALGVDLSAAAGFALDVQDGDPVGIAFFGVSDAPKLGAALTAIAAKLGMTLEQADVVGKVGKATVYWMPEDDEAALVITGSFGLAVFADQEAPARAKALVTLESARSLAASPQFAEALEALSFGKQAAGYVDLRSLVRLMVGVFGDYADKMEEAESQVIAARGEAEPDEEKKKAIAEAFARREKRRTERRARESAERKKALDLVDRVFGDRGILAMGVNVASTGLASKGVYVLGKDAVLSRLMVNAPAPVALVRGLDTPPLYLVNTRVDLKLVTDLVKEAIKAFGEDEDIDRGVKGILALSGIDLFALDKTFSGEVGVAVTGATQAGGAGSGRDWPMSLGGAAVIGLADEATLKSTVDRLMSAFGDKVADVVTRAENGDLVIAVPRWRSVHVRIGGGYLAASTDPGFFDRLGSGPGFTAKVSNASFKRLLTTGESASTAVFDWGLLELIMAGERYSGSRPERVFPPDQAKSERVMKILALQKQIRELEDKGEERTRAMAMTLFGDLGTLGARMWVDGKNVVAIGGMYFDGKTPADIAAQLADLMIHAVGPDSPFEKARALRAEMWALEDSTD